MIQKQGRIRLHGKAAVASIAFMAASAAYCGCEPARGGPDKGRGGSARQAQTARPGTRASAAASSPKMDGEAPRAEGTGSGAAPAVAHKTLRERLQSAAETKEWEIRERINASAEQDLHITVTLSVGAAGHPVSVIGATASTTRGGASRGVADILGLDTSGLSMESTGAKRTTTESLVIKAK